MTTTTLRVALATAFLAMSAASVQAQTPNPVGNTLEMRVINHRTSPVRVYAEDTFGRIASLGWVNSLDARTLAVPVSMTKLGAVQIKVFPDKPVWSLREVPDGVRTMPVNLRPGDAVSFWVETELSNSYIQIVRM